jgi:hypothetical protein
VSASRDSDVTPSGTFLLYPSFNKYRWFVTRKQRPGSKIDNGIQFDFKRR